MRLTGGTAAETSVHHGGSGEQEPSCGVSATQETVEVMVGDSDPRQWKQGHGAERTEQQWIELTERGLPSLRYLWHLAHRSV